MSDKVTVRVGLSKGTCYVKSVTEKKIIISRVLELAQLVQSLDSVGYVYIAGDSPPQLDAGLVRHLRGKTEKVWVVNGEESEEYYKSDER